MSHESTGEARDKHHRCYQGDQVNAPPVVASAHKFDMGGAVFVSICVKAHGGSLHLRSAVPSEKFQMDRDEAPLWPTQNITSPGRPAHESPVKQGFL